MMNPEAFTTTPAGEARREVEAVVFVRPATPVPARVLTTPVGVTARRRWFPESVTTMERLGRRKVALGRRAENMGLKNFAEEPGPSANPWEFQEVRLPTYRVGRDPARVVTPAPQKSTNRSLWVPYSVRARVVVVLVVMLLLLLLSPMGITL